MPEDDGPTTWTPKRGRLFQILVWGLIGLIVAGVLGGLWMVIVGR